MTANICQELAKIPNRKKHFRKYSRFNRIGRKKVMNRTIPGPMASTGTGLISSR